MNKRLLTKNELSSKISEWETQHSIYDPFHYVFICEAQDTKTARMVAEEIEGAFPWIKQGVNTKPWQALKDKYLKR